MSLEEGHTWLCNMGNQTDLNDATWIQVNPTILAIRWLAKKRDNALKRTYPIEGFV